MALTNYQRGRNKEYRVMEQLRKEGWTCLRTAGSHGFCDIIAFKPHLCQCRLIQCKLGDSYTENKKKALLEENKRFTGHYTVTFEVL